MKNRKQDKQIRELFRNKLENAELIPHPSVGTELMRKLAVREFLRFNPFRFNIYYLGGIVAAGIATVMILTSDKAVDSAPSREGIPGSVNGKDSTQTIIIPYIPPLKEISSARIKPAEKKIAEEVVSKSVENINSQSIPDSIMVKPKSLNGSLKDKAIFSRSQADNSRLQTSIGAVIKLFEPSVTSGCAPLTVYFKNNSPSSGSCKWTFGDGGSSEDREPEWIFDVEGEYNVTLTVTGPEGVSVSSALISVFAGPTAGFELSPEKAVLPDDEIRFLNYSAGAVRFIWNFGDGSSSTLFEPVHKYDKFGHYNVSLKVYSENGCIDSLTVYNAFSGSEYFIEFPNAFIPNPAGPSGGVYSSKSDESAQVFHPSFSGVSEYQLKVFSKLGVLLFESSDINIGWDGYFKGQLSNPGVYIWKVRGNYSNGEPFTKMGDVTLLKN